MRPYIALTLAVMIFILPWFTVTYPDSAGNIGRFFENLSDQLAAVLVHNPRTVAQLQNKYTATPRRGGGKIRVLLVAGHEPHFGGTEFGSLKERDMNVDLVDYLGTFLSANPKYEVIVVRDKNTWSPTFDAYFRDSWEEIIAWQKEHKQEALRQISISGPLPPPKVHHNAAPDNVAYRLYGLTKWSNEHNIDIALHVHFNDYPGHGRNTPGKYSGFSVYSPEQQYANGTTTRAIAETIFKRLAKYNAVSDLPSESDGIIEERELIAIGANNTADAASLLIEYGYIYEPQFTNPESYDLALKDLAFQTYLGLEDFFNPRGASTLAALYDTLILPHTWHSPMSETAATTRDVFALQTALLLDGLYPPKDKNKNDCPRTGKIGVCTRAALQAFQQKYGISEEGVGEKTIEVLNKKYSGVI